MPPGPVSVSSRIERAVEGIEQDVHLPLPSDQPRWRGGQGRHAEREARWPRDLVQPPLSSSSEGYEPRSLVGIDPEGSSETVSGIAIKEPAETALDVAHRSDTDAGSLGQLFLSESSGAPQATEYSG